MPMLARLRLTLSSPATTYAPLLRTMPPGQGRNSQVVHTQTQTIYQGPLPPPENFAAYEHVLPGAADRILKMAENQAAHGASRDFCGHREVHDGHGPALHN